MIKVDLTLVVSLTERTDRRKKVAAWLNEEGIKFTFWDAVKDKNGRQGLITTMKELFTAALVQDIKTLMVFEDDAKPIHSDFSSIFQKCLQQLPTDFKALYLGCNLSGTFSRFSENLLKSDGMYSSHAILYSRKAIEKILPLLTGKEAYDVTLATRIQPDGNTYCSYPLLVSQQTGYSDIENKTVNYERFIERRYAEKTIGMGG